MRSIIKKYLTFALLVGGLGILVFGIKYFKDISYQGTESIRFLERDYNTLEELLEAKPFRGKIVYVDLWFSTCSNCRREFKHFPPVKEYLEGKKEVEILYLSHKTRHPNDRQLWKNAIQELDLRGWHFMMDRRFEKQLWTGLNAKDSSIRKGYPHYLIIDNSSGYKDYNAPKPSEFSELQAAFESLSNP